MLLHCLVPAKGLLQLTLQIAGRLLQVVQLALRILLPLLLLLVRFGLEGRLHSFPERCYSLVQGLILFFLLVDKLTL